MTTLQNRSYTTTTTGASRSTHTGLSPLRTRAGDLLSWMTAACVDVFFLLREFMWERKISGCLSTPAFREFDWRTDLETHKVFSEASVFLIKMVFADKKWLCVSYSSIIDIGLKFLLHFWLPFGQFNYFCIHWEIRYRLALTFCLLFLSRNMIYIPWKIFQTHSSQHFWWTFGHSRKRAVSASGTVKHTLLYMGMTLCHFVEIFTWVVLYF